MTTADVSEHVLLALAKRDKSDLVGTLRAVTEASAEVLGVARAGVWRLADDDRVLVSEDTFLRADRLHTAGDCLLADAFPAYFAALLERRTLPADYARTDPRTAELREGYLDLYGIRSMMDVPIWHRSRLYGVLCNEATTPRRWKDREIAFATNLSDLVSLSLEASARQAVEQSWAAVVDAIGEAVFLMDESRRIEPANPKMRDLLLAWGGGATLAERERLFDFVDLLGRPLSREASPAVRAFRGDTVVGEVIGVRKRDTDELRYYRVTITPIEAGLAPARWVGVLANVSDEIRFEQIKRQFLDDVAHELQTPVAVVKGYSHVLARSRDLSARHRGSLDAIERAADRMARLVHGLVDVSGILFGRLILAQRRVPLRTFAERMQTGLWQEAPGHAVEVRVLEDVDVLGDPERLERTLRELVEAIARAGHGPGRITLEVDREGGYAVLTVRVEGLALTPDRAEPTLERLHGPPDDTSGLLSLVFREIIRAHGGYVSVRATEDYGVVRIVLPAAGP